jgi:hypothetical protein
MNEFPTIARKRRVGQSGAERSGAVRAARHGAAQRRAARKGADGSFGGPVSESFRITRDTGDLGGVRAGSSEHTRRKRGEHEGDNVGPNA